MTSEAVSLPLRIEAWSPTHPRWAQLQAVTDAVGQTKWANIHFDWHQSHHLLVALRGGGVIGFLHLVMQSIGADDELPPTRLHGQPLLEGKVMAFAVNSEPLKNLDEAAAFIAEMNLL
ncbi:MAG: hypothetical protein KDE31_36200 [Caldilineaceae bacterium]|nr:hypothetical protein [Caldilineaceae bacterium]